MITREDLSARISNNVTKILNLFKTKGDEYANDGDAYHNFNEAAKQIELETGVKTSPYQAAIGMQVKHTISINDLTRGYIKDMELVQDEKFVIDQNKVRQAISQIDEKFDDFIVYQMLKKEKIREFYENLLK